MGKEIVIIGIAAITIGLVVYSYTSKIWPSIVPIILGLALIIFSREEDKLEKRKDEIVQKTKKPNKATKKNKK